VRAKISHTQNQTEKLQSIYKTNITNATKKQHITHNMIIK